MFVTCLQHKIFCFSKQMARRAVCEGDSVLSLTKAAAWSGVHIRREGRPKAESLSTFFIHSTVQGFQWPNVLPAEKNYKRFERNWMKLTCENFTSYFISFIFLIFAKLNRSFYFRRLTWTFCDSRKRWQWYEREIKTRCDAVGSTGAWT